MHNLFPGSLCLLRTFRFLFLFSVLYVSAIDPLPARRRSINSFHRTESSPYHIPAYLGVSPGTYGLTVDLPPSAPIIGLTAQTNKEGWRSIHLLPQPHRVTPMTDSAVSFPTRTPIGCVVILLLIIIVHWRSGKPILRWSSATAGRSKYSQSTALANQSRKLGTDVGSKNFVEECTCEC